MENRALGKGLSALIPERVLNVSKDDSVAHLSIEDIDENSLQPRSRYDEDKLSELMQSIKDKGILQPILVRPKNSRFEIVAGERRFRAAKALKLKQVPVIVKEVNDQEALVLALVENIQRQELNPIEEALAFRKLINEFNYTQDSVAQSVGKDRSTISNLIRLLKLPDEIQKSITDGKMSMGQARCLLGVDNLQEQKKLFELALKKQLSVRELESIVAAQHKPRPAKAKTETKDHHLRAFEEDFQKALGTKVRILSKKKRGKIVIEYYSVDDLERIRSLLKQ